MIWIVVIGSILAIGAIVYGVVRARRASEALGMAQIRKWKKGWVPITLLIDSGDFHQDEVPKLIDAVKSAARFWNEQTGIKLFASPAEVGTGATIPVMRHDPLTMDPHENAVAYASLAVNLNGTLTRAAVYMVNWENLPSIELARAMKHELGHCLGLAHDENDLSVMYGQNSRSIYCVSPADKAFLREVYG
jgi:hypothetical protein